MSVRLCVLIVTFRMEFMEVQGQVDVWQLKFVLMWHVRGAILHIYSQCCIALHWVYVYIYICTFIMYNW